MTRFKNNYFLNNLNGVLQIIAVNLATGFAGLFLKRLNAGDELVSLFNSLPAFFSILAIFIGGMVLSSTKNKKKATSYAFLTTRSFYLLMALVPFLNQNYRALLFVILYSAMSFPNSIAVFLWQSFIADIFPPGEREQSLSSRNSIATIAGTATTLIAGFLLSSLSKSKSQLISFYQVVFIIAFIFGIIEVFTLLMHRDSKHSQFAEISTEQNRISIDFIKNLKHQREYLIFIISVIIFHFTWQMAWPLFLTYEVDYLHTNEFWTSIISTINGLAMAFGYRFWGRFSRNKGNSIALTISAIGISLAPFLYSISTKIYHVTYFVAITGFSVSGVLLLLINSLYEVAPRENRTSYIAFYNLVTNITLFISPWIGMQLSHITSIKTAFIIVGFLRILSGLVFLHRHKIT
ncbi:2-acyl-glycerophospho-ethanolamine acyltransferase [Caloramator mitchellensis]|uniref:2-acyl-glycerophospho-ethanolamine acyltransferase n=1 Tax=Caloramator mitchellensis TaxID=908809 RepID=A0A0R3JW10_CALMK|nr:MFS transporter [Caloramator mitchellensis]KRQ87720.1 2-acyl-glycerophospho-ethanolamine acyltransferase [Caloramator mitchellensis]